MVPNMCKSLMKNHGFWRVLNIGGMGNPAGSAGFPIPIEGEYLLIEETWLWDVWDRQYPWTKSVEISNRYWKSVDGVEISNKSCWKYPTYLLILQSVSPVFLWLSGLDHPCAQEDDDDDVETPAPRSEVVEVPRQGLFFIGSVEGPEWWQPNSHLRPWVVLVQVGVGHGWTLNHKPSRDFPHILRV